MPKFHVISGSLILGSRGQQQTLGVGAEVELSDEEKKSIDPKGEVLVTAAAFADLKRAAEAQRAFLDKQEASSSLAHTLSPKLLDALAPKKPKAKKEEPAKKETK